MSALLLDHLEDERDSILWEIAKAVVRDDAAVARASAGALFKVCDLLASVRPPERPAPPEEEEFVDPAALKKRVKPPATQTTTLEPTK